MVIKFKNLFSFKKSEIKEAFEGAQFKAKGPGLKLLQSKSSLEHGKILIIIPKRAGKASKRNKFRRQVKSIFFHEKLYEKPIISILLVYEDAMELTFEQTKTFLKDNL